MHVQAQLNRQITFWFTMDLACACQCACRPFGLPLGSLLYLKITMHLQARLDHQITFQFTIRLASSMPVCMQTFWLASGLTALPQAHHARPSLALPSDHLSVHRQARLKHASVCTQTF